MKIKEFRFAFIKTLPILFTYVFLSMAFGIVMHKAGLSVIWAYLVSLLVYTGAFQFVLAQFLAAQVPVVTVILTALAMNARHIFYGISFLEEFKSMGKRYPYMILTLTDETYSLSTSLEYPEELNKKDILFYIAALSRIYWMIGTLVGAILGQRIPFDFAGVDFCMTALFITIFLDQWKKADHHFPAIAGLALSVFFLIILGKDNFLLPALICTTILLLLYNKKIHMEVNE